MTDIKDISEEAIEYANISKVEYAEGFDLHTYAENYCVLVLMDGSVVLRVYDDTELRTKRDVGVVDAEDFIASEAGDYKVAMDDVNGDGHPLEVFECAITQMLDAIAESAHNIVEARP
jgi:hypothetical protein